MDAEPVYVVESLIKDLGLENIREEIPLIYYDVHTDCYMNARTGKEVDIVLKNGAVFKTKKEIRNFS